MKTKEIKNKLREYIEGGDSDLLLKLHETAIEYINQKKLDTMIAEGEKDISDENLHSQDDVQKMIETWTKE